MNLNHIKKRYYFCAILVLFLFLPLTVSIAEENIEEQEVDYTTLAYSFQFIEPTWSPQHLNTQQFTRISMSGTLLMGEHIGGPQIPARPTHILLPAGTTLEDLSVTYAKKEPVSWVQDQIDLRQHPITPYQQPQPIGTPSFQPFQYNNDIYNSEVNVPGKIFDYEHIGYCRGYTIVSFTLFPTNYQPAQGLLSYYPTVNISIQLKQTGMINSLYRGIPEDEAWVKTLVTNPHIAETYPHPDSLGYQYTDGLCDPMDNNGNGYDYVIITTEALVNFTGANTWDDLIDRKAEEGLHATKITVEDIISCSDYWNTTDSLFNDTAALIREFCRDAYQDWNAQYILIGGDDNGINKIERREMDSDAESNVETDIYWTRLDHSFNADGDNDWGEEGDIGFDFFSELYSGSIPCDEGSDVSNWLTKCFLYDDTYDIDYLENAAFYGGDTGWQSQSDTIIEFSAIEGTDEWMGPNPNGDGPYPTWLGFQYGFETWNANNPGKEYNLSVKWTAEPPNPGWQGGSESTAVNGLKTAINNDECTLISGLAHAHSGMSLDVYASSWESSYHNTKPFFLTDQGCHCGDMDASDDGVLHSMLFHSDTELAFAVIYNTGYGWGNYDGTNASSAVQMKSFWDYMFDISNHSQDVNNWQLGKAQEWARDLMGPMINWNPDGDDGSYRNNIQGCLLFGDPAQRIKIPFIPDHDIKMEQLNVSSVIPHDETQNVSAVVYNVGTHLETGVVVDFLEDGMVINSKTIQSISSFERKTVWFDWRPTLGNHTVEIASRPVTDEYDLTNNQVNTTVSVVAAPSIHVSPLSLSILLPSDATDDDNIIIENLPDAQAPLTYMISYSGDQDGSWLSANPDEGSIGIGASETVTITTDSTGFTEGIYQGTVIIESNDVDDPMVEVAVEMVVVYGNDFEVMNINYPTGSIGHGSHNINASIRNLGFYDQQNVEVNCTIFSGFLDYLEDFEEDDGNYTIGGTPDWEWGNPTSGPNQAYSGTNCWATHLHGSYSDDASATVDSVSLFLPSNVTSELSFWQWYDIEDGLSHYDGGNVKISTDGGSTWQLLGDYLNPYPVESASVNNEGIPGEPCFSGSTGEWEIVSFDLSDFAGETVRFRWHFGSDTSVHKDGWYIDNVTVGFNYGRDGNQLVYTDIETISINAYETRFVSFNPAWTITQNGYYTVQVNTCLSGDEQQENDQKSTIVEVFEDVNPPVVTDVNAFPNPQLVNETVNISCTITDETIINDVAVLITGPSGFTPINTSMSTVNNDEYYHFQNYTIVGNYSYCIWANDASGNGIMTSQFLFQIVDDSYIFIDLTMEPGWNMIAVPIDVDWNASDLAAMIQGCISVSKWNATMQTYDTYIVGGPPSFDFLLKEGHGYFVDVDQASICTFTGLPVISVNVSLKTGWNMIGWYHELNTSASDLAAQITECSSVSKWNTTEQTYDTYIVGGPPSFDFTVRCGMGLFVDVDQPSYWHGEG